MNIKHVILILALAISAGAQTVELSALNYGTLNGVTWQQRDATFFATMQAMLDNHVKSDTLAPILYHYIYAVNDSAISYIDSADSLKVVERYINYRNGQVVECPVTLKWATISKASPAKVSIKEYAGWKGGPWDKKIEAVPEKDKALCAWGKAHLDKVNAKCLADAKKKRKDAWTEAKAEVKSEKEAAKKNAGIIKAAVIGK